MTNPCKHFWVRYTLENSAESRAQQDGVDAQGRPYRDVPMQPRQVFAYAETIGSSFEKRTLEAACRDCGTALLSALREELS